MVNNNFSLGRRKFLQGVGLLFGSVLASGAGLMNQASARKKNRSWRKIIPEGIPGGSVKGIP